MNKNDISKCIYVFRHGETDWNVEKRVTGQLEGAQTIFTENGIKQIKSLPKFFKDRDINAIFASDLMRARDTALMINEELNVPISFHSELRGLNMGKYQGILSEEFIKEQEVLEAFKDHNKPIPGGESINQLINRLVSFINKIVFECPYKNIAIVSHGAAISNLKAIFSGDSYIEIDRCVLLYENNMFKVIESGIYSISDCACHTGIQVVLG